MSNTKRGRGSLRRWWAKGAPERGDWHWLVAIGAVVLALLAVLVIVVLIVGANLETGSSDWSGRLFTYHDGRLDVDVGNIFLLAVAIGLAFRWFGPYRRGD